MIAYMLGRFVGGVLMIWLFTLILGRFALKSWEPSPRAATLVAVATVLAGTLAGFGEADGGPFAWGAFYTVIPSAIVVWMLYLRQLRQTHIPE